MVWILSECTVLHRFTFPTHWFQEADKKGTSVESCMDHVLDISLTNKLWFEEVREGDMWRHVKRPGPRYPCHFVSFTATPVTVPCAASWQGLFRQARKNALWQGWEENTGDKTAWLSKIYCPLKMLFTASFRHIFSSIICDSRLQWLGM
jgi:hypothetical protein